jgi:hypothetical protein
MSELQQEKKTLSFEEICPQWARRIAGLDEFTEKKYDQFHAKLINEKYCFVGEAHGFNGKYHCDECDNFSLFNEGGLCEAFNVDHSPYLGKTNTKFDWNLFNRAKEAFVKHFNEVHVK